MEVGLCVVLPMEVRLCLCTNGCILVVYRVAVFIAEEREKPVVDREKKWLLVNRGL